MICGRLLRTVSLLCGICRRVRGYADFLPDLQGVGGGGFGAGGSRRYWWTPFPASKRAARCTVQPLAICDGAGIGAAAWADGITDNVEVAMDFLH